MEGGVLTRAYRGMGITALVYATAISAPQNYRLMKHDNTTLLSLCREICLLVRHLHKTFNISGSSFS